MTRAVLRFGVFLPLGWLALLAGLVPAAAEPRTALVVGNARYVDAPLQNPVNDATDMAAALRSAGFEVILKTDADQRGILEGVRAFNGALKAKGGVGLFFFSGHGAQVGGENYLVPVGAPITSGAALKAQAVTAAEVVDAMSAARNGLNIVVLDACRNNPMGGTAQGLSRIDSSASLFVSFATSPGKLALDGTGRNSPYTKHLAQAINASNVSLEETFKRTLKGVYQETRGEQTPWISSSFFGDFVFRPGASAGPGAATPSAQTAPREPAPRQADQASGLPQLTGVYRSSGTNPDGSPYRGTTAITMEGDRVRFTWWIGSQVYTGAGQFAGRMLVVQWGAKHPVIYTFGRDGRLDGEWADGTATDRLELFGQAAKGAPTPGGRYTTSGRNPDGSRYSGTVSIARRGGQYELEWQVGSTSYRGTGTLENNLLTVNWGSTQPLVYALSDDGTLRGLWEGGRGEDVLTPAR